MYLKGSFQQAYVCRDLEKGIRAMHDIHGVTGKWQNFDVDMDIDTSFAGRGRWAIKAAMAWLDDVQYELIEPVGGLVQPYTEFLPDDDSLRFHHVGIRLPGWDVPRAEIAAKGWPVSFEGGIPGMNFIYIDARKTLGHYLEYAWLSDELWATMGPE